MVEKLPIVYVRGFAGDTSGINKAVADPFYGFNEGSTHVRVGGDGEPIFYQFESPLLRLHLDEEYQILVQGGQLAYLDSHEKVPPTASGSIASTTSPPPPGLSGPGLQPGTRRRGPACAHRETPGQDRSAAG
jgi:hypothetical protein